MVSSFLSATAHIGIDWIKKMRKYKINEHPEFAIEQKGM